MKGILDSDVIIGDDGFLFPFEELRGHLEIHDIAGVVLDDPKNASAVFDLFGRSQNLVGSRRSEYLSGASCVQHSESDKSCMQRLVAGSAARNQRDLAGPASSFSRHQPRIKRDFHDVGMGESKAAQALDQNVIDLIDQFLHCICSNS